MREIIVYGGLALLLIANIVNASLPTAAMIAMKIASVRFVGFTTNGNTLI